ncbi:MAG TPA: hypothetical protein VMV17_21520 [Streptosporangiaceae bacterium]|nr:hypothetical protein [Streptosporangiaceae bacterium]
MPLTSLDERTALVLIDLQNGLVTARTFRQGLPAEGPAGPSPLLLQTGTGSRVPLSSRSGAARP